MTAPPRHHTPRNPDRPTNGPGVALIGAAKGRTYMPWQRDALDVALELDPETGHYCYGIVVISVPRQSGKTTIEGDAADHRCLTTPRARVWITMQNGKTADSWMREEHHADLAAATVFGAPGTPGCRYTRSPCGPGSWGSGGRPTPPRSTPSPPNVTPCTPNKAT